MKAVFQAVAFLYSQREGCLKAFASVNFLSAPVAVAHDCNSLTAVRPLVYVVFRDVVGRCTLELREQRLG